MNRTIPFSCRSLRPAAVVLAVIASASVVLPPFARSEANRSANASSSAAASRRRIPYRQLSWEDFAVNDDSPGLIDHSAAQTETFLGYAYEARVVRPAGADTFSATVSRIAWRGGFDPAHSWRRSAVGDHANDLLLHHEQGHLDINERKLRDLRAVPLALYPVGKGATTDLAAEDLAAKLREYYAEQRESLRTEQERYDTETASGTSVTTQRRWNDLLTRSLAETAESPTASVAPENNPSDQIAAVTR